MSPPPNNFSCVKGALAYEKAKNVTARLTCEGMLLGNKGTSLGNKGISLGYVGASDGYFVMASDGAFLTSSGPLWLVMTFSDFTAFSLGSGGAHPTKNCEFLFLLQGRWLAPLGRRRLLDQIVDFL